MSLRATTWALYDTPKDIDATEFRILMIIADNTDDQGQGFYYSIKNLAQLTGVSDRTVQTKLKNLRARNLIIDGDQSIVEYLPANKRPHVYDLNMTGQTTPATPIHAFNEPTTTQSTTSSTTALAVEDEQNTHEVSEAGEEILSLGESDALTSEDSAAEMAGKDSSTGFSSNVCSNRGENISPLNDENEALGVKLGCNRGETGVKACFHPNRIKRLNRINRESARDTKSSQLASQNKNRTNVRKTISESDYNPAEDAEARELAYIAGVELETAFATFKDYYEASGKRVANWGAQFRLWLRRERNLTKPKALTGYSSPAPSAKAAGRTVSFNNRGFHTTSGALADETRRILNDSKLNLSMQQKEQLFAQALNLMIETLSAQKVHDFVVDAIA